MARLMKYTICLPSIMAASYLLALDQGTSSSRALLFDSTGKVIATEQREFHQYYPKPGWVEHDPKEIWHSQIFTAEKVISTAGIDRSQIAALGITNQRETTLIWDRKTGEPVYNAIVWQDRRTHDHCEHLRRLGHEDDFIRKAGLILDPYFSGTKIRWILDHDPSLRQRAQAGELCFGTVDSWLIWQLTDGKHHLTDASNASRTLCFNLATLDWDDQLLGLLDIPRAIMPDIVDNAGSIATVTSNRALQGIPICGIAGDQQAALFGQRCFKPGMAKNTYGTGCFLLMNTGDKPVTSENRLLSTLAWRLDGKPTYALEGSIFVAGAVVQWLRDELHFIENAADVEALAAKVPDSNGVVMVPAFAGLGAPYWNAEARGTLLGMTRGTRRSHIARACLNAIAYQTRDVLDAMQNDANTTLQELRVDGGATANDLLMQIQADIIQAPVVRPAMRESTALGAALLAAIGVGLFDLGSLSDQANIDTQTFSPQRTAQDITRDLDSWRRAVSATQHWART